MVEEGANGGVGWGDEADETAWEEGERGMSFFLGERKESGTARG